jgi:hypothetical protein
MDRASMKSWSDRLSEPPLRYWADRHGTAEAVAELPDAPDLPAGPLHMRRPREPETAMLPGMASPRPQEPLRGVVQPLGMPDTSIGPVALQEPARWVYDFDPGSGASRATYTGIVDATVLGGTPPPETGTGAIVLQTAPTIITPTLTGTVPFDGGTLSDTGIAFGVGAGVVGRVGVLNAPAGDVGEFISATAAATAINVTNNVPFNAVFVAVSAGDWDVWGNIITGPAAGTITDAMWAWASLASARQPSGPNGGAFNVINGVASQAGAAQVMPTGTMRIQVAAPANVYISGLLVFTGGTMTAGGFIGCRRR